MVSQLEFAISVGIFFVAIVIVLFLLLNFVTSHNALVRSSQIFTAATNIFDYFFGDKGVPSDWETRSIPPIKFGLSTDLYRLPIILTETNGTNRNNITINTTINFDFNCEKKAWNSTVRVYDVNNTEITSSLYNQTFCSENFLNKSDLVFNLTLSPNQAKTFFIFYSPEKNISNPTYTLSFPINATNYTVSILPEEKLKSISVSKLLSIKNQNYDVVSSTLGGDYNFYIEVSS